MSIKTILTPVICILFVSCGSTQKSSTNSNDKTERFLSGEEFFTQKIAGESQTDTFFIYKTNDIPDRYHSGFVRIVGSKGIGYTNYGFNSKNPVFTIRPQYKAATTFKGNYAVVAKFDSEDEMLSRTDEAADKFEMTGNEKWGVIDLKGNIVKDFVYTRKWDSQKQDYIYVAPTNSFWITGKGEIKGF